MTTYETTTLRLARLWKAEQDARPISQTERLLGEAYQSAREVVSSAYDVEHLTRRIKEERVITASDTAEIKQSIIDTQDFIYALISKLEDAKASLALAVEAGE